MSSSRRMIHVLRESEIAPAPPPAGHPRVRAWLLAGATAFAAFFVVLAMAPRMPAAIGWLQAHLALSQFWR